MSGRRRYPVVKVKGGWRPEEDDILRELVGRFGLSNWSAVSRDLNLRCGKTNEEGRIGKQCRERWNHHLRPDIKRDPWTSEEEVQLVAAHMAHGNHWSDIARHLPGRTENGVKNHWNATLRRKATGQQPSVLKEYMMRLRLASPHKSARSASARKPSAASFRGGQVSSEDEEAPPLSDKDEEDDEALSSDDVEQSRTRVWRTAPSRGRGSSSRLVDCVPPVADDVALLHGDQALAGQQQQHLEAEGEESHGASDWADALRFPKRRRTCRTVCSRASVTVLEMAIGGGAESSLLQPSRRWLPLAKSPAADAAATAGDSSTARPRRYGAAYVAVLPAPPSAAQAGSGTSSQRNSDSADDSAMTCGGGAWAAEGTLLLSGRRDAAVGGTRLGGVAPAEEGERIDMDVEDLNDLEVQAAEMMMALGAAGPAGRR